MGGVAVNLEDSGVAAAAAGVTPSSRLRLHPPKPPPRSQLNSAYESSSGGRFPPPSQFDSSMPPPSLPQDICTDPPRTPRTPIRHLRPQAESLVTRQQQRMTAIGLKRISASALMEAVDQDLSDLEDNEDSSPPIRSFTARLSSQNNQSQTDLGTAIGLRREDTTHEKEIRPSTQATQPTILSPSESPVDGNSNDDDSEAKPLIMYKIYITSFWEGTKPINEIKSDMLRKDINGEHYFALLACHAEQQRIADRHAIQLSHPAYRVSVVAQPYHATLAANRRRKTNVDELRDWQKILKELEDWHRQKRRDLAVDLIYHFARTSTGQMLPPTNMPSKKTSSLTITSSHAVNKAPSLPANNPTNRQLVQQAVDETEDPANARRRELTSRWACKDKRCALDSSYCWINSDGKHIPLDNKDIMLWSGLLERDSSGRITKEEPPISVKTDMMKKMTRNNRQEKRQQHAQVAPFASSSAMPIQTAVAAPAQSPIIIQYPPQQVSSSSDLGSIRTGPLLNELRQRGLPVHDLIQERLESRSRTPAQTLARTSARTPAKTPSRTPARTPIPSLFSVRHSSPVQGDLDEYISWLAPQLKEREQQALERARDILSEKYYGTEDVQPWKDCDERWEGMHIPPGIGRKIASNISRWRREQTQQQPQRPSPQRIIHSIEDSPAGYRYGCYNGDLDLDIQKAWDEDSQVDSQMTREDSM